MATTKDNTWLGRDTPTLGKKHLIIQYNKHASNAKMKSVTPEDALECLEDIIIIIISTFVVVLR